MSASEKKTISRDNFIDTLGISYVRKKLEDKAKVDNLYLLLVEFIQTECDDTQQGISKSNENSLDFKIPGVPIHFNLTQLLKIKIESFVSAFLILNGVSEGNFTKIGAGVVVGLITKINLLKKKYGELCVVESLSEIENKTSKEICLNLYGKECRYPNQNCQFENIESQSCKFGIEAIEETLNFLETKQILKKTNIVDPIFWKIIF